MILIRADTLYYICQDMSPLIILGMNSDYAVFYSVMTLPLCVHRRILKEIDISKHDAICYLVLFALLLIVQETCRRYIIQLN